MTKKKCKTCGEEGDCGGLCDLCANCWEVERRLADYLKSANGRAFVAKAMRQKQLGRIHETNNVGEE